MAENKGILPSSTFNTLGNNSNKWEAVYANKIVGPLTGNVTGNVSGSSSSCTGNSATATKATQDSAGQQINTTYIKGLSASNATLTYTKGNGTTGTVTVNNVATATNADKLDGYHYSDIINNVKSVGMGAPNFNAVIEFSIRAEVTTYTTPSNGYILTDYYIDGDGPGALTSIGNNIFYSEHFVAVAKNTLVEAKGYKPYTLNCKFYPCL